MEFEKVKDVLPLVEVNTTAAREHVPEIERHIRTIKERVRATTSQFPFNPVPKMVMIQTLYTVCLWLNAIRSISGKYCGLSPRELVLGRGVDYHKDCRADLGGYVEARPEKLSQTTIRHVRTRVSPGAHLATDRAPSNVLILIRARWLYVELRINYHGRTV